MKIHFSLGFIGKLRLFMENMYNNSKMAEFMNLTTAYTDKDDNIWAKLARIIHLSVLWSVIIPNSGLL
jgi:hypothetical protein